MRVAALYDIHGNLPALEAVLEEIRRADVDRVVVGGDVVPGPMSREVLACLRDLTIPVQWIHGNGEVAVLAATQGENPYALPAPVMEIVRWQAQQLRPEDQQQLASWPRTLTLAIPGLGDVLFCHATPRDENETFSRVTPEAQLLPAFEGFDVPLVICGHTHVQFDRMIGTTRVVNAGSVGMPFGAPGAWWLLLKRDVQLRRTRYDFTAAAERIRGTTYPDADDFAARYVLPPPS